MVDSPTMSRRGPLETAAWAAAGAAILGGGLFLGFMSAMLGRRREGEADAEPSNPDPILSRRVEDLATVVSGLQQRLESAAAPVKKLDAITERVGQLERRVEQIVSEPPAGPSVEQVLAAVEQMVAAKIGGLDERLTDQVHAIELLRHASTQTDALLHRLIQAVESLAEQSSDLSPVLQGPRAESAD
jgi:methyl-accepting chemotaxis protein